MTGRCVICGAPLEGSVCSYCGTPVPGSRKTAENSRFEQRARRTEPKRASEKTVASSRNKWVALVLCLTVGWLGIHRFYVGKIGTGISECTDPQGLLPSCPYP